MLLLIYIIVIKAQLCKLPFYLPRNSEPSGGIFGPDNNLIVICDCGTLLHLDLTTRQIHEDLSLKSDFRNLEEFGYFDIEGITMTDAESPILYIGVENMSMIIEYDYRRQHKILQTFKLVEFERAENRGLESISWVPNSLSIYGGYFYVGSQLTGNVFIYELPIQPASVVGGTKVTDAGAKLIRIWTPTQNDDISGIAHIDRYLFLNFDNGDHNRVMVYHVQKDGLPGTLKKEYRLDLNDAEGISIRRAHQGEWEVIFMSDTLNSIFAFYFSFDEGFVPYPYCQRRLSRTMLASASEWQQQTNSQPQQRQHEWRERKRTEERRRRERRRERQRRLLRLRWQICSLF
eukprot:GEMP01050529.1.p1 GENE.GEMP01050529.1~~GEMP01050529.1.p1  ORF type:complete len:346 (+),score=37.00 GEMP01050529.1:197-1234(+)